MDSSSQFLCDECGESFTNNQNRLRHLRTVHQGKKRPDNEKRKREVTDKARKQGTLACGSWAACEDAVESIPQAVFKPPAEYVMMAMKAHKDRHQCSHQKYLCVMYYCVRTKYLCQLNGNENISTYVEFS